MMVLFAFALIFICYILILEVYKRKWDGNLEIEVVLPSVNAHEGELSHIKEVVINDKFLPLPVLETRFYLEKGIVYTDLKNASVSDKLYRRDVFAVGMKRKISRTFEILCNKRGYYTLEKLELISYDLFMHNKFLGEKHCFQEFYVYPRRVRSDRIALPYQQLMGELLVRKKLYEDVFSFGGIRDYVVTDPMNRVNWKASARNQNLVVNTYESSMNQKVSILLDTYGNWNTLSEELNEESIRIAAALVERLLVQGVEVTLIGNGHDIVTRERLVLQNLKGMGIDIIKQKLSRVERGKEESILSMFDIVPQDTYVVLISKNTDIQREVMAQFQDLLWVAPYKGTRPEMNEIRGQCISWELESANLDESVVI